MKIFKIAQKNLISLEKTRKIFGPKMNLPRQTSSQMKALRT